MNVLRIKEMGVIPLEKHVFKHDLAKKYFMEAICVKPANVTLQTEYCNEWQLFNVALPLLGLANTFRVVY